MVSTPSVYHGAAERCGGSVDAGWCGGQTEFPPPLLLTIVTAHTFAVDPTSIINTALASDTCPPPLTLPPALTLPLPLFCCCHTSPVKLPPSLVRVLWKVYMCRSGLCSWGERCCPPGHLISISNRVLQLMVLIVAAQCHP